jgi:hypothetical protein
VAEGVELPRRRRLRAEHVALEAHAVHEVPDRRLGVGEVGVRLVVGAAHDLDAALRDEPAQRRAVLREGVPVRLQVVDLGEHEPVVRLGEREVEVGLDQVEPGELAAAAVRAGEVQLVPGDGVGGLRVPPDRVVVEVGDHVHGPARLRHGQVEVLLRTAGHHPCRQYRAGHRAAGVHADLDGDLPVRHHVHRFRCRDTRALDVHAGAAGRCEGDPDDLEERLGGAREQLGRRHGENSHVRHCGALIRKTQPGCGNLSPVRSPSRHQVTGDTP